MAGFLVMLVLKENVKFIPVNFVNGIHLQRMKSAISVSMILVSDCSILNCD